MKRKPKPRKAAPPARPRPELNEEARALLGRDEEKRPYRQRPEDASVEDALDDWPKDD